MMFNYSACAQAGILSLMNWYDEGSGLWKNTNWLSVSCAGVPSANVISPTLWWNSANLLEAVIDYSLLTPSHPYQDIVANTFAKNKGNNFLNNQSVFDDEGWWALTWVKAFDLTGNQEYLAMAETIFNDMVAGWDGTCGGGVWWDRKRTYKNAIVNELFLTLAARLYQRAGQATYLDWAQKEWSWFQKSGMINAQHLINDGLSNCQNNGQPTYTYNQGVILGGLVEMYKITKSQDFLTAAETLATATITTLIDANGILEEPMESSIGLCNNDAPQFKGIFMRNLSSLYQSDNNQTYRAFLTKNADSIYANDQGTSNQFGLKWSGPVDKADPVRQGSAVDALVAAIPCQRFWGAVQVQPVLIAMEVSTAVSVIANDSVTQLPVAGSVTVKNFNAQGNQTTVTFPSSTPGHPSASPAIVFSAAQTTGSPNFLPPQPPSATEIEEPSGLVTAPFYFAEATVPFAFLGANFLSQGVPTHMLVGNTYPVTISLINVGNTSWTSGGTNPVRLGSQNPQDGTTWGSGRVELPAGVKPGASVTFSFTVTAPTSPGIYNFQWRMLAEGLTWFGNPTTNVSVTVTGLTS